MQGTNSRWRHFWSDERGAIGDISSLDGGDSSGGQPEAGPEVSASLGSGDGSDQAAFTTLTDDSLIQIPGADKPISYKELIGRYVPKADHEAVTANLARRASAEEILTRAERIEAARQAAQPAAPAAPGAPVDPMSAFRGKPVISGDVLAQLATQLRDGDIKPLYEWGAGVNKTVADLYSQLNTLQGSVSPLTDARTAAETDANITTATSAGLAAGGVDLQHNHFSPVQTFLRELATDIYYAWSPAEGQTRAQYDAAFPDHFAKRFEAQRTGFRELERILAAQARLQKIPGRGGKASPSGAAPTHFQTPEEIAAIIHSGRQATA
jgi:hypothetical protein